MSLNLRLIRDDVSPDLMRLLRSVPAVRKIAGMAMRNALISHFRTKNATPNRLGGARTNFWLAVANACSSPVTAGGKVVVSTHTDAYTQDDIPADQAPALTSVVSALVGLAAPWQASQVWARLAVVYYEDDLDPVPIAVECVVLTVEAVNDQGGRRMFDITDYSEFFIQEPSAVGFFKYFTRA